MSPDRGTGQSLVSPSEHVRARGAAVGSDSVWYKRGTKKCVSYPWPRQALIIRNAREGEELNHHDLTHTLTRN